MASSSSSSQIIPSSVSQSWKHEVFISFRGEDTRKGFVDHLYEALVRQGIQTYKDDETLVRGESIGPALRKAIQESHIAVIVFSKNYADSSWCLDELAYIIECRDNKGQIVMPVFYDVDPSDVRKQKRKYGEAFDKHECDNMHKIESWRKALVVASNLSGWVLDDFANGQEAKCIKDIVEKISAMLPQLIPNDNKDLIGIETRLQDLKSKLKIGSGGVRVVGIWGVGGGGKSTLAFAAYTEISHQFEASCLLENIREESSKHGMKRLQEMFLSFILKTKVELQNAIEGMNMIKRRLCHKTVLVVLDDVDDYKQLNALAGSNDWFGEGSRIIITTRDEHLLTRRADTIYEVSLLSHEEAIKLFSRHAFQKDNPVEDYDMLSQKVVSYAGGLPLAIEILGSFLYDKDKDEWKSTLAKLKCIPDVQVMERLKISYDGLKLEEKELFLDIACLWRRCDVDSTKTVLDACGLYPGIGVKVLAQKGLIKVSNGKFDMHDLIEEMAHYIVRGEHPNNPEKHSRIWKRKDIVNLCAMGASPSLMETEVLALRDRALDENINFWDSDSSYDNQQLLLVIANMKKLRLIDWSWYPLSSFPSSFQATKLGCLMLTSFTLKQLWEGYKLLPNLKILDLSFSRELLRTPDFKGLPCLEKLNLHCCESLEEIHQSIGFHERLVFMNMTYCSKLKKFPPITRMKQLETLDLFGCEELQTFPDILTNMDSLVNLNLSGTGIELIPPSVGQFCANLVSFDLTNCKNLKRIAGNFCLLKHLKTINLDGCYQLEKLAEDFVGKECGLEVLSLSNEDYEYSVNRISLKSFHQDSSVSQKLPQFSRFLKKLDLSWCDLEDGYIPSDMSGLLNLQALDLRGNPFSRLHSSLSKIPCLKFLDLSLCRNLVELPDLPSSIAILIAEACESLRRVGDLSNCKWLWKVSFMRNMNKSIGGEIVHSMLQRNAVEDHYMSIVLPRVYSLRFERTPITMITLQLPPNWYNDFSGFLLCAEEIHQIRCSINIKMEMLSMDCQPDHWDEFVKNPKSYKEWPVVGYVPFRSLRHTSWWNPAYTHITFQIKELAYPKVGLVPRESKSRERPTHYTECWEETGDKKTFQIRDCPKSSEVEIEWSPRIHVYKW